MARDWDPMNLDNIISSNSTSQSSSPINHSPTDHAPALAALIRTATPSSIVKRIFFAKIWRKVHDILCIKIRSFEIKQVDRDYDLKLIASQDDIDGSIISSLVYPEYNDLERLSADSEHESGPESYRLPPQIIVLALQRGLERSLIFTFAYSDSSGAIRFAICRYPLACLGNNTMGTNMAVDPR